MWCVTHKYACMWNKLDGAALSSTPICTLGELRLAGGRAGGRPIDFKQPQKQATKRAEMCATGEKWDSSPLRHSLLFLQR